MPGLDMYKSSLSTAFYIMHLKHRFMGKIKIRSSPVYAVDSDKHAILPQGQVIHTHRGKNAVTHLEFTQFYPNHRFMLVMPKSTRHVTQALSLRLST